ncbi:MAG TPA: alpha-glucuronidase family glycosyl hydrolase, partial [Terriglobia bacterium]|nr:alpha-glucuronidase family glycosyl hydrolase [Terriglobia bacterium]
MRQSTARRKHRWSGGLWLAAALLLAARIRAETGEDAWLRYAPVHDPAVLKSYDALPAVVVRLNDDAVVRAAQQELVRGVRGMLGRTLREETQLPAEGAIVLGTVDAVRAALPAAGVEGNIEPDGYCLKNVKVGGHTNIVIAAANGRGVLYGVFAVLRNIALGQAAASADKTTEPSAPIRWVDQWDNLDGTIERGYGGRSIFFADGHVVADLGRAGEFARLLASVGVNGCVVNNVNADARLLTAAYLAEVARIADAFRPWGVRLGLAVDLSSPKTVGGLDTFDPLNPRVAEWWRNEAGAIYRAVPDFGGFVVKADSEGRAGPSEYARTHADAANVIARALKPYGGIVFYRAFVYNHHLDWRNLKNDRARAAYDNFQPLDGHFDDNVVIQIKNGPIDFQVREPASPLFGALKKTNQAIEVQITQEYTGQQRHLCFLVPMWKEVLDFDMHARGAGTPVKDLVTGRTFHRPLGGFVGVSNVGRDANWMGSDLAQANLYGFGRLAWDPNLTALQIADEWTRQTLGTDARVEATVPEMLLESWGIYEEYTGPLGVGTLTDILGPHYGPGIESAERSGWGQWIRADSHGIGMDRTPATGTGYIGQYRPAVAKRYESLAACPDNLLLFMHHVPYTYRLHSGETVIQYIYNSHYEGAAKAGELVQRWRSLAGRIDEQRYGAVLSQLEYQAGHARVWRDAVCSWFLRASGIPDAKGRAGHFPNRVEAEAMKLDGYQVVAVTPWETASGGKAIECARASRPCTASFRYEGPPGRYDLGVEYFDQNNGASRFRVFAGSHWVDEWVADAELPSRTLDGSSSTRRLISGLALRPGDEIRIEGAVQGGEN